MLTLYFKIYNVLNQTEIKQLSCHSPEQMKSRRLANVPIKNNVDKIVYLPNLTLRLTPCLSIYTSFQETLHRKRNPSWKFMNRIFPLMKKRWWKDYFVIVNVTEKCKNLHYVYLIDMIGYKEYRLYTQKKFLRENTIAKQRRCCFCSK